MANGILQFIFMGDIFIKTGDIQKTEDNEITCLTPLAKSPDFSFGYTKNESLIVFYKLSCINLAAYNPKYGIHSLDSLLTEEYKDHLIRVTWQGTIPANPHRDLGKYENDNTIAFLDADPEKDGWLELVIFGETVEAVKIIYEKIRTGNIKPSAENNWSQKQISRPNSDS